MPQHKGSTTGIQAELDMLTKAGEEALPASKMALYEGAGAVADAVAKEAGKLPFKPSTVRQIQGAVGIAKFQDSADGTETSISFDGYFADSGFPIPYFVRELQIGTSRVPKIAFVRKAAKSAERTAVQKMQAAFEAAMDKFGGKNE